MRYPLLAVVALSVAACETAPVVDATGVTAVVPADLPALTASEAVEGFAQACVAALPDFASAGSAAVKTGDWKASDTGTYFETSRNASFKIVDGPGNLTTCSYVFASADSEAAVKAALAERGSVSTTSLGYTVKFDNKAVAFLSGAPRKFDTLSFYNFRLLSALK